MRNRDTDLWMGFESEVPIEEEGFVDVASITSEELEAKKITAWINLDPFEEEDEGALTVDPRSSSDTISS